MYAKVKTVRRGGRSYEYLELVEGRREASGCASTLWQISAAWMS